MDLRTLDRILVDSLDLQAPSHIYHSDIMFLLPVLVFHTPYRISLIHSSTTTSPAICRFWFSTLYAEFSGIYFSTSARPASRCFCRLCVLCHFLAVLSVVAVICCSRICCSCICCCRICCCALLPGYRVLEDSCHPCRLRPCSYP